MTHSQLHSSERVKIIQSELSDTKLKNRRDIHLDYKTWKKLLSGGYQSCCCIISGEILISISVR